MKVSEQLLEYVEQIWQKYYTHPFILGIQDGNLDKEKFKYYILQDYVYLIDYCKVFAIGIAKATSFKQMQLFSSYVTLLTEAEMEDVHSGYMAKLGVTETELKETKPSFENLAYTSYMQRIAYEGGEAEIMAAILSCAVSYEYISKKIVENNPKAIEDEFYGDWIKGYTSERYTSENKVLLDNIDQLTLHYTEKQIEHLKEIFRICSLYELAFWDMAYQEKHL